MKDKGDRTQLLSSDDEEMNSKKKIICSYSRIRKLGLRLLPPISAIIIISVLVIIYSTNSRYHRELSERIEENSKMIISRFDSLVLKITKLNQANNTLSFSLKSLTKQLVNDRNFTAHVLEGINAKISDLEKELRIQNISQSNNTKHTQNIQKALDSLVKSYEEKSSAIKKALDNLTWYQQNLAQIKTYGESIQDNNKTLNEHKEALDNLKWYQQNLAQIKTYRESIQNNNKKLNEHDEALDNLKWYEQNLAQIKTYRESIQDNNKKLNEHDEALDNLKWYEHNLAKIKTYEESIQDNNKKLDSRKSYEDNLSRDVMSLKKRIEKIEQRENKEPRLFRLDYSVFIINIMTSLFALSF